MSTPTPVPTPVSSKPATLADIEAAIAAFGTKAKAEESKIVTWLKTQWPHFLTWASMAFVIFKKL